MQKDEIKEIIDYFRKYMSIKDCIKLSKIEDYITNLQEKYERMKENAITLSNGYNDLEKENEFLKLNNPEMNIEHFRIIKENKRKIDNLREENKRLKVELEKLLENPYNVDCINQNNDFLQRIKELKESDKDE